MSKPVWVQVLWSEYSRFKENELMTYIDFEIRALKAAIKKGYGKGYWKTKINVLFDDGNTYECRLDLAPHDTHGFEHHAKSVKQRAKMTPLEGKTASKIDPPQSDNLTAS